ncbi:AbrB/MazE/SpoVT family DNA-binding domain-containing protein [Azospirillum sp.]|uniref:AbrB/MazE/SpoVT family DNA-binding domain-containing protein n=1 Tax=Azospirillum sp. TaxID=34012 RepID=UPI002D24F828|nr:AbrB/MazE/SpoVT family DNA-binding domain-containing protein [Azospirillum sp.]HYD68404.1 AbrB/MazE/SpoVT family DNA-binding domain-containing protein [Azospirillum sp.]
MPHVSMAPNGRLVIPAPVRAEVGMAEGGTFVVSVQDGKVVLEPYRDVLERVRAEVRRYIPAGTDLAEDLSRDRRAEAERE